MTDYCTVTIDGSHGGTYYVACDQVEYLTSDLCNNSNSTINLYPTISADHTGNYIRVTGLGTPEYRASGSYQQWVAITDISSVTFNSRSHVYRESSLVLLFALFLVCIASIVKVARG